MYRMLNQMWYRKIQLFWNNFSEWYNSYIGNVSINVKIVLFGDLTPNAHLLNCCILHAKWFLHKQYLKSDHVPFKIQFDIFLGYLKDVLEIEKSILVKSCKLDYFQSIFGKLVVSLG